MFIQLPTLNLLLIKHLAKSMDFQIGLSAGEVQ